MVDYDAADEFVQLNRLSAAAYPPKNQQALRNFRANRYLDVLPHDDFTVALPGGEYINASHVNIPFPRATRPSPSHVILTQAPVPETFDAFWRMVYHHSVSVVVMLTQLVERTRDQDIPKADAYWAMPESGQLVIPASASEPDGPTLTVRLLATTPAPFWTERVFAVCCSADPAGSPPRTVTQLHLRTWPDLGVADLASLDSLAQTAARLSEQQPRGHAITDAHRPPAADRTNPSPVVIHCSAGLGRASTFAIILAALAAAREGLVDRKSVVDAVWAVRQQRHLGAVQSAEQLALIHQFVKFVRQ
jgi:protein tyrosine phosphatase